MQKYSIPKIQDILSMPDWRHGKLDKDEQEVLHLQYTARIRMSKVNQA